MNSRLVGGPALLRLREGGRKRKQENKGGPGARPSECVPVEKKMTALVQVGCNGHNVGNGPPNPGTCMTLREAILASVVVGTPQRKPPGAWMAGKPSSPFGLHTHNEIHLGSCDTFSVIFRDTVKKAAFHICFGGQHGCSIQLTHTSAKSNGSDIQVQN